MGAIEAEVRKRARKDRVQQALLGTVALSGLLLWSMAAPNTLQLLTKLGGKRVRRVYQLKSVASRLSDKGLVRFVERKGQKYIKLTQKGSQHMELELKRASLDAKKRKRWDGKWRMVVFDIPESRRPVRDKFRILLRSLGYVPLQASVWVYPYDSEEIVTLIKAELGAGSRVLYAVVDKIEYDAKLRKRFGV